MIANIRYSLALGILTIVSTLGQETDSDSDCNAVVFDRLDKTLHVRTMVVEDTTRQRMLVLLAENDTSMPCKPRWWLDHNPQGVVQCLGKSENRSATSGSICNAVNCEADAANVQLGYVRTMLASAVFMPQAHTMSALCIELGCRSRITRTRPVQTLLEAAPAVQWVERSALQRVLVIGLGSSTMALWIRNQLPNTELHVAELIPGVAEAAPCFGLNTDVGADSQLHIHVGDGRTVLEESPDGHFDAILVDAFDHDASLPPCFRTSEFFAIARRKLLPGGALSFNLFADGSAANRIVKALMQSFDATHVFVGDAPGAEGIQDVVTAFAPGRSVAKAGGLGKIRADDSRIRAWFGDAKYRVLRAQALKNTQAFQDSIECPRNNTIHHG